MQVDAAPEENENVEEEQHYTVENPSMVRYLQIAIMVLLGDDEGKIVYTLKY